MNEELGRDLSRYVVMIRRRWWIVALVTMGTIGASAAYTFTQPSVYRAEMKILVGQGEGTFLSDVGNVADQFTQTMSDLLESDVIATRVIDQLGLDISTAKLFARLSVVTKPSTAVMRVFYDDTDRERGRDILAAIGEVFEEEVAGQQADPSREGSLAVSATVFDPAHMLPGRISPTPTRNLAVAGILGLLLGFLLAFVREQLDDTVRSVEEAERAFGQVATGVLPPNFVGWRPLAPQDERKRNVVLGELAIRRLGAAILWSPESRETRTIAVTSANAEEGKTTVSAGLAVSLARAGHDVILVEADLGRPMLSEYLGLRAGTATIGLDALVRGQATVEQALVEVPAAVRRISDAGTAIGWEVPPRGGQGAGRLRAILARPGSTWPAELNLEGMTEILRGLEGLAQFVIIDTSPILVLTDAYPPAATADTVIAVVRSGRATAHSTAALARTLRRVGSRRVELVVTEAESGIETGAYGSAYEYVVKADSAGWATSASPSDPSAARATSAPRASARPRGPAAMPTQDPSPPATAPAAPSPAAPSPAAPSPAVTVPAPPQPQAPPPAASPPAAPVPIAPQPPPPRSEPAPAPAVRPEPAPAPALPAEPVAPPPVPTPSVLERPAPAPARHSPALGQAMEAVVIGVDGAAPARLGARMVLDPRGGRLGSLGDDALDVAVANDAMFVEPTSGPVRRSYGLSGGSVEVLLATKEVRPKLVILSATPVALELLVLAKLRGYETLLVEPRPERVTAQYLGAADLVVPSLDEVVIDEHTVAVHTDHGAPDIVQAVATLLRARAGFVAVTGDPGASVLRLDSLRQMGFGDEELSRVRIPSATATERPGDVALAIASQLGPSNGH